MMKSLAAEFLVPPVAYMCHDSCTETGSLIESAGGWIAKLRWQQTAPVIFKGDKTFTPEAVALKWNDINNFDRPGQLYPTAFPDIPSFVGID
jgi:multifunctional beta-oxidation protein